MARGRGGKPRRGGAPRFTNYKQLEAESKTLHDDPVEDAEDSEGSGSDSESQDAIPEQRKPVIKTQEEIAADRAANRAAKKAAKTQSESKADIIIGQQDDDSSSEESDDEVADLADLSIVPQLSRREKEARDQEAAKKRYETARANLKTPEAIKDMERLAIVRARRAAEAAKKEAEAEVAKAEAAKRAEARSGKVVR